MMVDNNHILIDGDGTVIYLSDTDTSDIFIVIDGADQYLGWSFRVSFRCGNVIKDRFKQRLHIFHLIRDLKCSYTILGRSIHKWAV